MHLNSCNLPTSGSQKQLATRLLSHIKCSSDLRPRAGHKPRPRGGAADLRPRARGHARTRTSTSADTPRTADARPRARERETAGSPAPLADRGNDSDGTRSPRDSTPHLAQGQDNHHTASDIESSDNTYQPSPINHRNRNKSSSSTSESNHRQRGVPRSKAEKRHRRSRSSLHYKKRLQVHTSSSSSDILSSSSSSSSSPAYRRRKRRRRHSSSPSSSSSSTSSPSSTSRDSPRRHRRSHYRRKHRVQHRRSRWTHGQQEAVACAPPLPHRLTERIRKGKYIDLNKLLLPVDTPPLLQPSKVPKRTNDKSPKRSIIDLPTWLEAWNRFLCAFLVYHPSQALELAKYQTMIVMFFANHPASQCIEYDRLFRQAVAKDRTIRWDSIKEDIYVWSLTRRSQPFRESAKIPVAARLGPPTQPTKQTTHLTHTTAGREICKRFNAARCPKSADDCIFAHVCWYPNCQGPHPGKGCPTRT